MAETQCSTVNEAARLGILNEVTRLIAKGLAVDAADNQGWRPLHSASANNHPECVLELLNHANTDVSWSSHEGYSALYLAAKAGHTDIMKILLDHRANINQTNHIDSNTPLHAAVKWNRPEAVKLLICAGADINLKQFTSSTPLHLAASAGRLEILQTLLLAVPKIDVFEDCHISPIFCAAQFGHDACLKELLEYAKAQGHTDLVSTGADDGGTPLYIAAQEGFTRCVKHLLANGADANALTNKPVALPLHAALQFAKIDCVRHLLPYTDKKLLKYCNISPFDMATSHDNHACLQALIDFGYNVNYSHPVPDDEGYELKILASGVNSVFFKKKVSPLVSIAMYRHPISSADILFQHGANVVGRPGEVPPLLAALNEKNYNYAHKLVSYGAPVDIYHPACCGNLSLISCLHYWKGFVFLLRVGADPTENFRSEPKVSMDEISLYFDENEDSDSDMEGETRPQVPEQALSFYDVLLQARQVQMSRRGVSVGMVLYQMLQYSGNVRLDPVIESLMEDPRDWATLQEHANKPRTLSHLSRLTIRKTIGSKRLAFDRNIKTLPLPETIIHYLLFRELYDKYS